MKNAVLTITFSLILLFAVSQDYTLTHDGMVRTYRLHLPVSFNPDTFYPLVINMHGLGSNAFEQEIYTEFNNVADTGGFIVAYPNGINETWNISSTTGTDDVGFISALIDTLDLSYNIDIQRVYATGMSMGGFMCYRLACELSDRIAAIASVTGLQAFYPCNPSRNVPVMQFHGTADPIVPYTGVATTISNWVNYNGCPSSPEITDLPDIDPQDNSTVTVTYYGLCYDSTEVILYTINGGEHTWPGATILIGVTNQDIKASNEIWYFFQKYTLQESTVIRDPGMEETIAFTICPNPLNNYATVEISGNRMKPFSFKIKGINGITFYEINNLSEPRFLIDCSHIPKGFYIAEIGSEESKSFRKIIIQ